MQPHCQTTDCHNHVGLPVFFLFASLLTAFLTFILSAENDFFFCALYWWDQNTQWFKIWCLHKIWCFQDPFHVPWKLWKVWFGRIASDRDRWLFDVKTVKMVHWSVMHELRLITVGTGYCPVMVHWSVSLELNASWWLWARVTIIMSWFTDLWHELSSLWWLQTIVLSWFTDMCHMN